MTFGLFFSLRRLIILLFFIGSFSAVYAQNKQKNDFEFNFSNFELINLVDLMSKLTGRTFLYNERDLSGRKVSLVTPGKYSQSQALGIFEAILDVNDLTTIRYDNFTRIINKNSAKREQTPIAEKKGKNFYNFITRVIKLEHINVNTARSTVTPLISASTTLVQYAPSNILIIRDTAASSDEIIKLLKLIDQPGHNIRAERIYLQNADVNQTGQFISRVISQESSVNQSKPPIIIPDQKTNSLIVAGKNKDLIRIRKLARNLDVKQQSTKLQIFKIVHGKADDLQRILVSIFQIGKNNNSINIVSDRAFNRLIITARQETLDKLRVLIDELDKSTEINFTEYRVFRLSNANAKEIAPVLQKATRSISLVSQSNQGKAKALSPPLSSGTNASIVIIPDEATNSLVVYANSNDFPVIEKIIADLDTNRPQVFVEALILEMSLDKSLNLGVNWKRSGEITQNGKTQAVYTVSNTGSANPSTFKGAAASTPAGAAFGVLGKSIPFGGENFSSFSAFILANRTDSEINILSNPKILTLNNKEAEIKVGEVRPFQTALKIDSNGAESRSFEYKEVGVTLKITPQINPDGTVRLSIIQSSKEVRKSTKSGQQNFTPVTLERKIKSDIVVGDGEIVALGGLINDSTEVFETKTPCLGDIPLLGWLFKSRSTRSTKINMMVLLTPTIIQGNEDLKALNKKVKDNYSAAASKNFRLDLSEELDLPSILIPIPEEDKNSARKKYQFRNLKIPKTYNEENLHQENTTKQNKPNLEKPPKKPSPTLEFQSQEIPSFSSPSLEQATPPNAKDAPKMQQQPAKLPETKQ